MEYFAKRADYIESTINEAKENEQKKLLQIQKQLKKKHVKAASKYREILDQAKMMVKK